MHHIIISAVLIASSDFNGVVSSPVPLSLRRRAAMARSVNIGLATEVVTFCDALCVSWRSACAARARLAQVKAQSYIDRFESKLCDACVACENALDGVKACLAVATEDVPAERARRRQRAARRGGFGGEGGAAAGEQEEEEEDEEEDGEEEESAAAGAATIAALLRLVSQAAMVARAEGWDCEDLLDAVSKDVVTFARNVGLPSRLAPSPWLPGRGKKVKSRVRRGGAVAPGRLQEQQQQQRSRSGRRSAFGGRADLSNSSTMRSLHRPKDAVQMSKHRPNQMRGSASRGRAPQRHAVNKRRPNRPAVAEPKGSLDLAVGAIKYDMAKNPFARALR